MEDEVEIRKAKKGQVYSTDESVRHTSMNMALLLAKDKDKKVSSEIVNNIYNSYDFPESLNPMMVIMGYMYWKAKNKKDIINKLIGMVEVHFGSSGIEEQELRKLIRDDILRYHFLVDCALSDFEID